MASEARRRLIRDFKKLHNDPPYGVSAFPVGDNLMKWKAVIIGPDDTSWESGTFELSIKFNEDFPVTPPEVRFVSRMFHPNVYMNGSICLDILQNQWSPVYDISAILTSIQSLLNDPNPYSPANEEAARLYAENRREYNRRVQSCVADSLKGLEQEEVVTPVDERKQTAHSGEAPTPPSSDTTAPSTAQTSSPVAPPPEAATTTSPTSTSSAVSSSSSSSSSSASSLTVITPSSSPQTETETEQLHLAGSTTTTAGRDVNEDSNKDILLTAVRHT